MLESPQILSELRRLLMLTNPARGVGSCLWFRGRRQLARPQRLLIFVCVLFPFSGCQRPAARTSDVTVTLIDQSWLDKEYQDRRTEEISEFTRETGIHVKVLPSSEAPVDELSTWLSLLGSAAKIPDVYAVDVIWPKILADNLIDLKAYVPADEIAAHAADLVANDTVDGRLVALPYHIDVGLLYYRTDLLHRYGFRDPPKTWDELETMSRRIQAGERAKGHKNFWGFIWQGAPSEVLTCNALEWQESEGGGAIIENRRITVNNRETIQSWQRAARWVGSISPPGVVAYQEWDTLNIWKFGGAAFMRSWSGWLGPYLLARSETPGAEANHYDVAPLPAGRTSSIGAFGGHSYGVSKYSAHPQEAVMLVRYLCRRDVELKRLQMYSGVPTIPQLNQDPSVRAAAPYLTALQKAYKNGFAVRPSTETGKNYPEVSRAYFEAVHSVLTGQTTAAKAAADLQEQLVHITGFEAQSVRANGVTEVDTSTARTADNAFFRPTRSNEHGAAKRNFERAQR
jgi:trehalose/maltose transport system substrate-binding protein